MSLSYVTTDMIIAIPNLVRPSNIPTYEYIFISSLAIITASYTTLRIVVQRENSVNWNTQKAADNLSAGIFIL